MGIASLKPFVDVVFGREGEMLVSESGFGNAKHVNGGVIPLEMVIIRKSLPFIFGDFMDPTRLMA
jgi:hypothetical protein